MNRGRKPNRPAELVTVEPDQDVVAQDMRAMTQVGIGETMVLEATEVLKMLGRIEMGQFLATVADRAIAETYIRIKESKAYKGLPYKTLDGKVATVATLEEFCDVFMPKSRRRCEELASNLHLLGPDLYDQAEAIGFRQRDYAALKALPADDQVVVRQAIEAGKLDNAIELMQDMAARHKQEKDALSASLKEAQEKVQVKDHQLSAKDKKINELDAKLSRPAEAAPVYDEAEALRALDHAALEAVAGVHARLRKAAFDLMGERPAHALSRTVRQAIAAALGRVSLAVADLGEELDIPASESAAMDQGVDPMDAVWAATNADMDALAAQDHDGPVQ